MKSQGREPFIACEWQGLLFLLALPRGFVMDTADSRASQRTQPDSSPYRLMNVLLQKYKRAAVTYRQFAPAHLGMRKIGHFGFFRPGCKEPLWQPVLEWIQKTTGSTNR